MVLKGNSSGYSNSESKVKLGFYERKEFPLGLGLCLWGRWFPNSEASCGSVPPRRRDLCLWSVVSSVVSSWFLLSVFLPV